MDATNRSRSRARRLGARSLMVGMAAAAFAGIGAGTAYAGDPEWDNIIPTRDTWWGAHYWAEKEATGTEYSFVAFRETIKPWDSISIPSMGCQQHVLEDKDYSPGRIVPRGIEVVEPGGIGVTITKAYNGPYNEYPYYSGIDSALGQSSATNWDPFNSRELTIVIHCTKDLSKGYKASDSGLSPEAILGGAKLVNGIAGT